VFFCKEKGIKKIRITKKYLSAKLPAEFPFTMIFLGCVIGVKCIKKYIASKTDRCEKIVCVIK